MEDKKNNDKTVPVDKESGGKTRDLTREKTRTAHMSDEGATRPLSEEMTAAGDSEGKTRAQNFFAKSSKVKESETLVGKNILKLSTTVAASQTTIPETTVMFGEMFCKRANLP